MDKLNPGISPRWKTGMLSYRPCRHKSYRIGKEELPSLTSALNWRRVLIGMGQSCPSRGQECRSPVKPSGKVLSGQARMPGVPGVKNPARTST